MLEFLRKLRPAQLVLEQLRNEPDGLSARDIVKRSGSLIVGLTIHSVLLRLQEEGLVSSVVQSADAEHHWKSYRRYRITEKAK